MKTYRIRPLTWDADGCNLRASSVFGEWRIVTCAYGCQFAGLMFHTIEDAKLCAEKRYLSRLLPALEEVA